MQQSQIQNIAPLWRMYMPFPILPPMIPQQYCPPQQSQTTNEFINIGSGNQGGNPSPVTVTEVTTATYDILFTDYMLCVDYQATSPVLTLPEGIRGTVYIIKDCGGEANTIPITIQGFNGELVDDGVATINTNYGSIQIIFNGSNWSIV